MNPRKQSFRRKIIYLVCIAVLLGLLSVLGRPADKPGKQAEGSPGGVLARMRNDPKNPLSHAQLGEIDPTGEAIKLATLGLRGVAANVLWEKANRYMMKKDWTNFSATLNQIIKLQPNFISVWRFQAWNVSFNISVQFDDFRDRYRWVIKGIDYLQQGIRYNRREPTLLWEIGRFLCQKIGRSDERLQFRRLFRRDDVFHGSRPVALRDNWLVAKQWYQQAIEMVEKLGVNMKISPWLYHSNPPLCQINYAENLEKDGIFGEKARRAWAQAAEEWNRYGSILLSTTPRVEIRLNDEERIQQEAKQLVDELDAMQPGLRETIRQEKIRDELTDEQREAIDTPEDQRTTKQHELAATAQALIEVTHKEVARRITGPQRRRAAELAKEATEKQRVARIIRLYRSYVDFTGWRLRVQVEQTDDAVDARELVYYGKQALNEGQHSLAKEKFDQGLEKWRKVIDRFPALLEKRIFLDALARDVKAYKRPLSQLGEEGLVDGLPRDFILKDVVEASKKDKQ